MANLTVVPGGLAPKRRFSMNARGLAKYMVASPYAARKIVEDYAFPKEGKAKIILRVPAKDVVLAYFKSNRDERTLHAAIEKYGVKPAGEKAFARTRRTGALNAAKILLKIGPSFEFSDVHTKACVIMVEGLPVRASIDFFCKLPDGRNIAVIFNVASEVSDDKAKLDHYAKIECEIAWQATRAHMPSVAEVWYVDLFSEKIVRKHGKSLKSAWRNIETTADNILIAYKTIIVRRTRQRRARYGDTGA